MTSSGSFGFNPILPLNIKDIATKKFFGPGSAGV